jgi:hypothetical protein
MSRVRNRKRERDSGDTLNAALVKFATKAFFGLVVIVVFLSLAQCTIRKPESPVWNTNFTVPLINRTYPMEEIVRRIDQDGIEMDSAGNVTYTLNEDLDTIALDASNLSTSDLAYSFSEKLGVVTLDAPGGASGTHAFNTVSQLIPLMAGDEAAVPGTNFSVGDYVSLSSTFSTAVVANGQVVMTVDNRLGVDLDTVIVTIVDNSFGLVAVDTFPGTIPDGAGDSLAVSLNGRPISSQWQTGVYCHTPGGYVTGVHTRYVGTTLTFPSDIQVSEAIAQIPAMLRDFSSQANLAESDRIDTAVLSTGSLDLSLVNNTNLDANLTITIPDLKSGGVPLTINETLSGQQTRVVSIDLAGRQITPSDHTVPQLLDIDVTADLPGSGTEQVHIAQSDSISVNADLSSLSFSSVTGVFDSLATDFDGISESVDVPVGFDSVEIQLAILTLEVQNRIDMAGELDVVLTGNNGRSISLSGPVAPAGDSFSVTAFTVADSANFLAPIPSEITASGTVRFGDGVQPATLRDGDYVFARVQLYAPMQMVVKASTIRPDIEEDEIDQDNINAITDHVVRARFTYNVINHLPLGAAVRIYLGPDSANLFTNYQLRLPKDDYDTIFVTQAPVSALGIVTDTISTGQREILLDSADVRVLENDTLYIGQEIILEDSQGIAVRFTQSDFLKIVGRIEVEYRFDGEF